MTNNVTTEVINSTEFPRLKNIPEEIIGVLDGPEQECYPLLTGIIQNYITDPAHGGKVTCHKCNGFVAEGDSIPYLDHQHPNDFPKAHFHKDCYNPYEHYYGLDRPID